MKTDKHLYAVILAGGSGTRFWPVSRRSNPKQFLNITGKGSLLQETLRRISPKISGQRTYIVTNAEYRKPIERQVARFRVPKANILLEPCGRNTAPAICWAAAVIHQKDPHAVMVVLPSDHLIAKRQKFISVINAAVRLARQDYLVTLGIVPTRPETGYGYLKTARQKINGKIVVRVEQFVEKPSFIKAKRFVKNKNYYWNSGMFIWKSSVILEEFKKYLRDIYRALAGKAGGVSTRRVWHQLPNISVDYGILEKSDRVTALPASDMGWSDLGSWESLIEVLGLDKQGNIFKGDVIAHDCRNSLVWADKKVIASVGLDGFIIVDTPDALLVCKKEHSQSVKNIVTRLQKQGRREI